MKKIFTLIFLLLFLQSYSQEYGEKGYQKKRFDEATEFLKNNDFESATLTFYFVFRYEKNELGKIALKKSDSILPKAQQSIKKKLVGKWILSKSGSNWGFKKTNDTLTKKILIIDIDKFSFYDQNINTKEMKLTKCEKINFTKNRNRKGSLFDFVFSDNTLWNFYYDEETKILKQIMTGIDSENGRSEIVCGNSEYYYIKAEK